MQLFRESNLDFSFPEDWEVKKFDETRFFKILAGEGFKGVDFIIITPDRKLILIEVKNYSGDWPINGMSPTQNLTNNVAPFSKKIIHKFEDSFHLIKIIQKYYHRKWWFRRFVPLIQREWGFWKTVNELLEKREVKLLLWLELSNEITEDEKINIQKEVAGLVEEELKWFPFEILSGAESRVFGR